MPDDLELSGAHARALFTHAARRRLLSVNEPRGRGGPRPALYSTPWENAASRSVARRLRLVQYAADFQVR